MKKQFAEYYELSKQRIGRIWSANSLIVFDTNVLLNLYRYNEDARNEFINVIKFYKERLWIPYQVGLEFHRRREDIMRNNAAAYKTIRKGLGEGFNKVLSQIEKDYARHPYIRLHEIKDKVAQCTASINNLLEEQEKNRPDYSKDDEVLNAVTELFDGRVGVDFSTAELELLYQEGEKRYANQVPPGYCDVKNKKDGPQRSLYGDLIVWKQTIAHSKEQQRSVIFVTDDHKLDWWDKNDGKHTPRKELTKEFSDNTGQYILIYDSKRFLEYAKTNKRFSVSQKTIDEVDKIKKDDESLWANAIERISPKRYWPDIVANSETLRYPFDNTNEGRLPDYIETPYFQNFLENNYHQGLIGYLAENFYKSKEQTPSLKSYIETK